MVQLQSKEAVVDAMAEKKSNLLKNVVLLVLVAGAGVFVYMKLQERQLILRENEVTEWFNQEEYDRALPAFKQIHGRLSGDDRARVGQKIALCYKAKGDKAELSVKEQVEFYRQALEYDESCITDPNMLRLIRKSD